MSEPFVPPKTPIDKLIFTLSALLSRFPGEELTPYDRGLTMALYLAEGYRDDEIRERDTAELQHRFKTQGETRARLIDEIVGWCGDYPAPCNCDDPETHNGH